MRFFKEVWRVVRYPLLFGAILILVQGVLIAILDAGGADNPIPAEDRLDDMLVLLISALLTLPLIWKFLHKKWKAEGFWTRKQLTPALIAAYTLLGLAFNLLVNGLIYPSVDLAVTDNPALLDLLYQVSNPVIFFIATNLAAPLIEEVIFRGIVLERLRKTKMNIWMALIIQALIFSAFHTGGVQITYTFFLGIILGLVYLWSGSVWAAIIVHFVFNVMSDVLAAFFSLGNSGVHGLIWVLVALVGLAATIYLLKYLKRKRVPEVEHIAAVERTAEGDEQNE